MTVSTPDVEHVRARFEALHQTGHERQDCVDERHVEHGRRHPRHQLLETWVPRVRDALAVREGSDHVVLDLGELTDELGEEAHVVRARGLRQARRVLGGRWYVPVSGSSSTIPPTAMPASHSRT